MPVEIKENDNEVIVNFPYNPFMVEKAKKVWPYRFDGKTKSWHYPIYFKREVYALFGKECPIKPSRSNFPNGLDPSPFLLSHQREGLIIAEMFPKFCLFYDTGTGKTVQSLEIIKHKQAKTIVVAPLNILRTVWESDIQDWYPYLNYINLYPLKKPEREAYIRNDEGHVIHIINYEGFKLHYNTIMEKGNYKLLILDESSKLKGRTTQIAKALIKFGQQIESAYLLSGTPNPNSNTEFYPQMELVAPGLLGYSYTAFRKRFFYTPDGYGYNWLEKPSTKQDFINRLKRFCIFVKKHDVIDLPERIFEVREVEMDTDQARIYKQMKKDLVAEVEGETVISPTVLSKIMRLRQITSGFLYWMGDSLKFADAKLRALKEALEDIGHEHQVIVWANFKEEIEQLLNAIPDSLAVYGSVSQKTKDENIEAFKKGKCQYIIANPASLGHGQTLVNASYAIYYSLSYSAELWNQSLDRIYRYGQRNTCTYIILNAVGTIDEIIYKVLRGKIEGSQEILEHLRKG